MNTDFVRGSVVRLLLCFDEVAMVWVSFNRMMAVFFNHGLGVFGRLWIPSMTLHERL